MEAMQLIDLFNRMNRLIVDISGVYLNYITTHPIKEHGDLPNLNE